jgi:hypothetical protein
MLVMRTTGNPRNGDPRNLLGEIVGTQEGVKFDHFFAPAVDTFRLYGVKPRALLGQSSLLPSSQVSRGYSPCRILSESGGTVPYVPKLGDFMTTSVTHDLKLVLMTN